MLNLFITTATLSADEIKGSQGSESSNEPEGVGWMSLAGKGRRYGCVEVKSFIFAEQGCTPVLSSNRNLDFSKVVLDVKHSRRTTYSRHTRKYYTRPTQEGTPRT